MVHSFDNVQTRDRLNSQSSIMLACTALLLALGSGPVGKTIEIAPGVFMPSMNLGTCCGSDPKAGLPSYLAAGGIGIDTAWDYHDQADIAVILKAPTTPPRSSLFITTKVPAGFGNSSDCNADPMIAFNYIKENLKELDVEYVDLALVHRPCQAKQTSDPTASNNALWKGMQMALAANLTRAIGVSNYAEADLKALDMTTHTPAVNQASMSLTGGHDDATIAFCQAHSPPIVYESYHDMKGCPSTDADVIAIAAAHKVSVYQVCLRWVLDRGAVLAVGTGSDPKTAPAYAKENLDIYGFALTTKEIATLNALPKTVGATPPVPGPNPIYDAPKYSTKLRSVPNGVLYAVQAPSEANMLVMHTFGTPAERGLAHGQLMSAEIAEFITHDLDQYYREQVDQIPLNTLPPALAAAIQKLMESAAPKAFNLALGYVWTVQQAEIAASKSGVVEEMEAIADGVCSPHNATIPSLCNDRAKLVRTIKHVNMLPELVRMQCSMMGAWGNSTPTGTLVQLRTLDFGGGPFADRSMLVVAHPTDSPSAFAALSFPSMVGIVTGFSEKISLSEKVDDVANGVRPNGTYKGQAVAMVIRDIVQFATTKEDAVRIAQAAQRTWSVWLGIGDSASQEFLAMLYDEADAHAFDAVTLPRATNQTAFENVMYIDKHPQPSAHPDMPALITQFYGHLDATTVAQNIPRLMASGDVHVAVYDWGAVPSVSIATGTTDKASGNYTRLACDAPYLKFVMADLWAEPRPTQG